MLYRLFIFVLLVQAATFSYAASFKVNPLKLEFSQNTRTSILELSNTSNGSVTLQIDARKWMQDASGTDVYDEADEIVFFPRIVTLKANEQRTIRIGFNGTRDAQKEMTYRIFVEELVSRSERNQALNFALRFSIPLFIQPEREKVEVALSGASVKNGKASVVLENRGNQHVIVKQFQVTGLDRNQHEIFFHESKGWYVLSGNHNAFSIKLSDQECGRSEFLELTTRTSAKTLVARVPKEQIGC
ncbi:MAG: fimbria/pilus periplasmic chaperone [Gammaproteobacteria bacterium]|nr:fimbria/pilus periplasmic chaperone [Gammaproteobacteria bacterium]